MCKKLVIEGHHVARHKMMNCVVFVFYHAQHGGGHTLAELFSGQPGSVVAGKHVCGDDVSQYAAEWNMQIVAAVIEVLRMIERYQIAVFAEMLTVPELPVALAGRGVNAVRGVQHVVEIMHLLQKGHDFHGEVVNFLLAQRFAHISAGITDIK